VLRIIILALLGTLKLTDNNKGILCFVQIIAHNKRPYNLEVNLNF